MVESGRRFFWGYSRMTYRLVVLAFAAALAACTTTGEPTATSATDDFDPGCEREYSGAAASALANSGQGCAIAPQ